MARARAFCLVAMLLAGCGTVVREVRKDLAGIVAPPPSDLGRARTAWSYFAGGAPAPVARDAGFVTPQSLGDDIAATLAARRIGLIDSAACDQRIGRLLAFLAALPLSGGVLPGRFHDAGSGRLVDPPGTADPGWSAVEIGQLLVWLRVLAVSRPQHAAAVNAIVARWQLCRAIDDDGRMLRALPTSPVSGTAMVMEPDVGTGYAGYAAFGWQAWGVAARGPVAATGDFSMTVEGIDIALPTGGQVEPMLTAPAALTAMVFAWKAPNGTVMATERQQADALLAAQQRRDAGGLPTARNSFRRSAAPYQVEDSVLAGGVAWRTIGDGAARPDLALVSVQAAFGLRALAGPDTAGEQLVQQLDVIQRPGGWPEGRYERGEAEPLQTSATNALVLAAVLHRQAGRLFPADRVAPVTCTGPR